MADATRKRAVLPARVLGLCVVPVAVPAGIALLLALAADWPRDLAAGSGLKLAGLAVAVGVTAVTWVTSLKGVTDRKTQRLAAVLCLMAGLFSWPLWSAGVLPSVNGSRLQDQRAVQMRLERTEITKKQRSRDVYHWAWLTPADPASAPRAGRYFISSATYDQWTEAAPEMVELQTATGLLGAVVVLSIR